MLIISPFAIRNRLQGGSSERIKFVWSEYLSQKESIIEEEENDIELPAEIAEKLEKNQQVAEKLEKNQQVAEKRVKSTIEDYQTKIIEFEESENQASLAIESGDKKIDDLESEIDLLQSRNEELVAENS